MWNVDDPLDAAQFAANATALLTAIRAEAQSRPLPAAALALQWHSSLYSGCTVPVGAYVGRFRGDPAEPALTGYEVGLGPRMPDGLTEKVGVWAADVAVEVNRFVAGAEAAVRHLDDRVSVGRRPAGGDEVGAVVQLATLLHGEWVRIHPFANGNGRTARTWANWVALRYRLPAFVSIKPRPSAVLYGRAAGASMGRPPGFLGDHAMTLSLFAHWMELALSVS